jgi:hypothetical protein
VAGALLGEHVDTADDSWASVALHVANEASFQLDNHSFNAFKHVARLNLGKASVAVQTSPVVEAPDDSFEILGAAQTALSWMRWTGKKKEFAYEIGAKEIDRRVDVCRIQSSASVVKLWREARLARLDGGEHAIFVPKIDAPQEPAFKFTMRFGRTDLSPGDPHSP